MLSAVGETRSSQAISPALLWERLCLYLLGSVCPILEASVDWAARLWVASAETARRRERLDVRIAPVKNPLEDVRETWFHDSGDSIGDGLSASSKNCNFSQLNELSFRI
jgi:hypothetical protein